MHHMAVQPLFQIAMTNHYVYVMINIGARLITTLYMYVEILTARRHDRVQTESQELQPWTAVLTM